MYAYERSNLLNEFFFQTIKSLNHALFINYVKVKEDSPLEVASWSFILPTNKCFLDCFTMCNCFTRILFGLQILIVCNLLLWLPDKFSWWWIVFRKIRFLVSIHSEGSFMNSHEWETLVIYNWKCKAACALKSVRINNQKEIKTQN